VKLPIPAIALGIVLVSVGLVLIAAFVEPFASMNPCPMCMMQRALFLVVAGFGALSLIAFKQRLLVILFSVLGLLSAIGGAAVASRQVWLQNLPPDQVPACGPPLEYMLEVFPLIEVIQTALMGTGDCAETQWVWLGLSIPGWSIVAFTGLAIANIAMIANKK